MQCHDLSSRWLPECRANCDRTGEWGQQRPRKWGFIKGTFKSGQEGFFVTSLRKIGLQICQRLAVKEVECEADHSSHSAEFKESWKCVSRFPLPQEFVCCLKESTQATQPTLVSFGSSDNRRFCPFPDIIWIFYGTKVSYFWHYCLLN
jgi:hypothetical protein